MPIALTRALSPRINECELSFIDRAPIDYQRATRQHEEYERCLEALGCAIAHVPAADDQPDGVFVEDVAVVLDRFAYITRPGAESRRGERDTVARSLAPYRSLRFIREPATVDGGDVLLVGDLRFAGLSERTNHEGIAQLQARPVEFHGCLHLKSAVTAIDRRTLLVNPSWVDAKQFRGFRAINIDPEEPFAANALRIGNTMILAAGHKRTRRILERRKYDVKTVDISELAKAEGGVTCCSLIID